jgi:hypothetical protein
LVHEIAHHAGPAEFDPFLEVGENRWRLRWSDPHVVETGLPRSALDKAGTRLRGQ